MFYQNIIITLTFCKTVKLSLKRPLTCLEGNIWLQSKFLIFSHKINVLYTFVLWYSSSINWWLAFLKQRLKVYLDLVIFSRSDSNDNLFPKFTILPKSIDPFRSSVFIWLFDGSDAVRYLLFLYFYTWEIQRMLIMLMYVSKRFVLVCCCFLR